jgi:hypothetical protein
VIAVNPGSDTNGIRLVSGLSGNPVDLVISSSENVSAKAAVYSISGSLMRAFNAPVAKGNTVISLNQLSGFAPGIYIMKVVIGQQSYTEKMVISK